MEKQKNGYINNILSPYLYGYRKGFSTQLALLLSLTEKWNNKGFEGAVLMDLTEAFETIIHELLFAKLHGYGFDKSRNSSLII